MHYMRHDSGVTRRDVYGTRGRDHCRTARFVPHTSSTQSTTSRTQLFSIVTHVPVCLVQQRPVRRGSVAVAFVPRVSEMAIVVRRDARATDDCRQFFATVARDT